MYFSSLGGNFLKAQMLNNYEKTRCEHHKGEIAKRRIESIATINKSIKDVQDTLRDIRASSGYCREMQKSGPVYQSGASQVRQGGRQMATMNIEKVDINKTQAGVSVQENTMAAFSRQDLTKTNLDCNEHGPGSNRELRVSIDSVEISCQIFDLLSQRNVSNKTECSLLGKNAFQSDSPGSVWGDKQGGNYKMNGDRDIEAAERLLRDNKLTQPGKKNPNRVIKGTKQQSLDSRVNKTNSDFTESQFQQSKRNCSPSVDVDGNTFPSGTEYSAIQKKKFQRPGSRPSKAIPQSPMPRAASPDELQNKSESGAMICQSDKSGVGGWADEPVTGRSPMAPKIGSRAKWQVISVPASQRQSDFTEKTSRSNYLSTGDIRKLKLHTSVSRTERKRILQELIANSTVTCDRSILEREKQRLLQDKISRFFELLFAQDDNDQSNDENDIICDD